jgi:RNA polymerase sigma-70 factor (ECF subfamily)
VTAARAEFRVPFPFVERDVDQAVFPQQAHDVGVEERTLAARLRRGELAALGEAYDAHHTHVRAFARRLLGDAAAAEDLVQETFLVLPHAVGSFRGDSTLRTFLVSIAVNHARHHLRSAMRRRAAHTRLKTEPPPCSPNPEDQARRAELAATLTRALDALPLEQRVAVVLCDVEERTSAEAAKIVGVPEGTIRTRAFHAKRRLREALAEEGFR